jgi:hypothetical protein
MHSIKTVALIALCFLSIQKFTAQVRFNSAKLEEIYRLMPVDCKNSINQSDNFSCKCKMGTDSLSIKGNFNAERQINHLGVDLFPNEMKLTFSDSELSFIERYFLEIILHNDTGYSIRKNQEDKIQLQKNGKSFGESGFTRIYDVLVILNSKYDFSLKHQDLYSIAEFKTGKNVLTLIYPANNNVVSGLDKKEYGEQIVASLKSFKKPNDYKMKFPRLESLKDYKQDIKISKGGTYINQKINSDKYFTVDGNIIQPLFSKQFSGETFCNLFLIPGFDKNNEIELNISHKTYADEKHQYKVNLNDFLIFFSKDFEFYFGVEECNEKSISGTLIMVSKSLNFINLLYVSAENTVLFGEKPVLASKFYTSIPSDNIKNMFSEFETAKNGRKKNDAKIYE